MFSFMLVFRVNAEVAGCVLLGVGLGDMLLRVAVLADHDGIVSVGRDVGAEAATLVAARFFDLFHDVRKDLKLFDSGVLVVLHACILLNCEGVVERILVEIRKFLRLECPKSLWNRELGRFAPPRDLRYTKRNPPLMLRFLFLKVNA